MNSKLSTLILLFLGLFISALFFRRGELIWLAFPLLIYVTIGLIKFPARDTVQLQAQRFLHRTDRDGQAMVDVEITLRNFGESLPCVQIIDRLPEGVGVIQGQVGLLTSMGKNGGASLNYSFPEQRGRFTWNNVRARVSDPLGVTSSDLYLSAAGEISIAPERENYQPLPLRSHHTLYAPGAIPARRAGSGTDFWGVRLYQPGDSLRWLDWRLNARHPGQFFTREFEHEEVADIGLILDARRETDLWVGKKNLFEHSVRAAASLADGFIHQGNRVSLLVWGRAIMRVFPGFGKSQLHRILDTLSGVRSSSSGKLIGLNYLPLEMFSNRAWLVILSPLTRSDSTFFVRARAAGYQVTLISPNPYEFLQTSSAWDAESQRAFSLARLERRILLQSISSLHIRVIDWQVSQPLFPLIRASLGHFRGRGENKTYYGA